MSVRMIGYSSDQCSECGQFTVVHSASSGRHLCMSCGAEKDCLPEAECHGMKLPTQAQGEPGPVTGPTCGCCEVCHHAPDASGVDVAGWLRAEAHRLNYTTDGAASLVLMRLADAWEREHPAQTTAACRECGVTLRPDGLCTDCAPGEKEGRDGE